MPRNDIPYHRWRAASEREAAAASADEGARSAHQRLADLHSERLTLLETTRDARVHRIR